MDLVLPSYDSPESRAAAVIPKDQMQVLSQEISVEIAVYRFLAGGKVRCLSMPSDTFTDGDENDKDNSMNNTNDNDKENNGNKANTKKLFDIWDVRDTMCIPYLFIPALPGIPDGTWTRMYLEKNKQGTFKFTSSVEPLVGIETVWHENRVDVLTLPKDKIRNKCIYETVYRGNPAIVKIANFAYDIANIQNETYAYSKIEAYQRCHPQQSPFTPKFLGHLVEDGRVIGFLLEKVQGRFASISDLETCQGIVAEVHKAGLIHGDVNRYNFIINDQDPANSYILDFEHSDPFHSSAAALELDSLPGELEEDTGRGMALL